MIDRSRQHEQEVGKAVHIRKQLRVHLLRAQRNNRSLRSPADGAGQMQQRTRAAAARQDEAAQRRQIGLDTIDPLFEPQHVGFGHRGLRVFVSSCLRGRGREPGPYRKQIALQPFDQPVHITERFAAGADDAKARVELIDVAICRDARIRFRDTRAAEQGGSARVTGSRVDLHGRQYT